MLRLTRVAPQIDRCIALVGTLGISGRLVRGLGAILFCVGLAVCAVGDAAAQGVPQPPVGFERPSDLESARPKLQEDGAKPVFDLPPMPEASLGESQGEISEGALLVETATFEGNTAISSSVLATAIEPFLGKRLSAEGIEALRRRVTEVYVRAGFVNSGAVIPAQSLVAGSLRVQVIEGTLSAIRFLGLEHYRDSVLRRRLTRGIDAPLNVKQIEEQIRLLDQDVRIDQINARLRPGALREEAVLEVAIVEGDPRHLWFAFDNNESPSVGAFAARLGVSHDNVFGFGDRFGVDLSKTEGLTRIRGQYDLPVHASGTHLFVEGSFGLAELVDNAFRDLEVGSRDASAELGLSQTLWHTPSDRVAVSVSFERRRSRTEVQGEGFSFVDGPQSGRSEISVVRASGEWTHRGQSRALSLRSRLSFGTHLFNPTTQSGETPDGVFISWYGQARGVYRLPASGIEFRLRADVQLSDRPLLSLEQFALGGPGSVRGYRRNQLVRDQGASAALDVRIPVWRTVDARTLVAVTPFADLGYAWDEDRRTSGVERLSAVGLGVEWRPIPQLEFGLEWAYGIRDVRRSGDLQDQSVYLRAVWRIF